MPVIDAEQLGQFQACFEPQAQRQLLKMFAKETNEDLACLDSDPRHRSHRIKGRAAQLGFVDLQHAAHALQMHCDADQKSDARPDTLPELVQAVRGTAAEALALVDKLLESN